MSPIAWIFVYLALRCPGIIFSSGACVDQHSNCSYWAKKGECTRNYLYMLQKCPVSCKVCSGGVKCRNIYNDQYCTAHVINCWRQSWATILVKNCRKTCVCSCCPVNPPTTATTTGQPTTTITTAAKTTRTSVRSTRVDTAPQTTTGGTGEEQATATTNISTQAPSISKVGTSSISTAGKNSSVSGKDLAETVQRRGFNTLLLVAIIAGVVVVLAVPGLSMFCWWRKKRLLSLDKPGNSLPSKESPRIPGTDSTPELAESPLYNVLEGPNYTSARKDHASTSFPSDPDYDDPTDQSTRSKEHENDSDLYEPVREHRSQKNCIYDTSNCVAFDDSGYSYSYNVANEDLSLRVKQNSLHEDPNTQSHIYHVLENPNAGYQAPEAEKEKSKDNSYEEMRDIDPTDYLPLNKAGQSVYQPLKKTNGAPRRDFTHS